jgi:hypothetical protein
MTTTNIRPWAPWRFLLAAGLLVSAVAVSAASGRTAQAPAVNADAAVIADFMKRVEAYAALRQKVDGTLKEPPRDGRPEMFADHEIELVRLMQRERRDAKAGDIFTKPMRNIVRRLLAGVFRGAEGREIKKSILDEETGHITLRVNAQYPEGAPLSTMPLQILQGLPKLPDGLEYRFIGERLILLDGHARLIVDVVGRVFP